MRAPQANKAEPFPPRLVRRALSAAAKKRCVATTKSGKPCPNFPLPGTKRCNLHTGDTAKKLGARGGRRRAIFNPEGLEPFPAPQNAGDLVKLLGQTIVEVRSGKLDPRVANSLSYVSAAFMSAVESADLDLRIRALEERRDAVDEARARVN